MTTIAELMAMRRRRTDVKDQLNAMLDKAEKAGRDLTPTEQRQYDSLLLKANDLRKQEDRYIKDNRLESQVASMDGAYTPVHLRETDLLGTGYETAGNGPATDCRMAGMFGRDSLTSGGFGSWNEFVNVVLSKRADDRLKVMTSRQADVVSLNKRTAAFSEGTPSEGGYLVPTEFSGMLLDASLESEIVRPRATNWPMTSATKIVPIWDGFDHSSDLFGGFSGTWLAEGGTATRQVAKLAQLQLSSKKLAVYTACSREVSQDGVDFGKQVSVALQQAISWYLDDAFINGSGAGQPLGILNSPSLIEVAAESGQAAGSIVYGNLAKMFSRLHPSCVARSVWICNNSCIPELLTLSQPVGTGGAPYPVLTGTTGSFSMLTRPVLFTEKVPALGSKGDIILVDLSRYAVGMRQQIAIDVSNAPQWLEDKIDMRVIVRCDGQATWPEAVTPKNGDSLSWAVTLAAR